ncbi:Aste57867_13557 [Aphanomyces stellatus]|uniref:Aste57867_13557 protein n=1 Tax=Aphanomyces stellatus TaxID=120398 RepID=A0A485KYF8_9STRA|nr:hypothetical protein As57867_013507 [Aphanomyces stellatus]VFT90395.1 Aste57867_13557 [Aphanomyces stellatus]
MGPIHYVASAWRSTDENDQLADAKTTDRTAHVQIGFRYGAQDVRLDNFFNDNEVDIFLQDISPYLPEHVIPRVAMVTPTTMPMCKKDDEPNTSQAAYVV